MLIFRGDTPQAAHDFVSRDPYVKNGLITEWSVRPLERCVTGWATSEGLGGCTGR
ncbi:MAG: hypothetical protein MZV63_50010 [Marinilabiliales bacterium]|nr:hypothetical protein [Marinilabiliales bacterium]